MSYGPAGLCVQPTRSPSTSYEPLLMLAVMPHWFVAVTVMSWHTATGGWLADGMWGTLQNEVQFWLMEPEISCERPLLAPRSHSSPNAVSTTPSPHQFKWHDHEHVFPGGGFTLVE